MKRTNKYITFTKTTLKNDVMHQQIAHHTAYQAYLKLIQANPLPVLPGLTNFCLTPVKLGDLGATLGWGAVASRVLEASKSLAIAHKIAAELSLIQVSAIVKASAFSNQGISLQIGTLKEAVLFQFSNLLWMQKRTMHGKINSALAANIKSLTILKSK